MHLLHIQLECMQELQSNKSKIIIFLKIFLSEFWNLTQSICSQQNGEELPRREISKNGKVGLIMWAFRFGERDINFDLPKDLLALPPPGIQVTRLN